MLPALRSAIRDVDPRVGATVRPLRSVLRLALFPARAAAVLLGALGLLALVLTMTGLYGLIAYSVSRRTSEIGVRMALGATQAAVLRLVLLDGLRVSGAGLVIGVLLALAAGRVVQSLLVGVSGSDPVSFGVVVFVLLATGMLASYLPARRAARIDPMTSLRQE
jgi:putative ABC transport system permease protein